MSNCTQATGASQVFKTEIGITRALCASIGSVRALTVDLLIAHEEWDQLINLSIDPCHYDNHHDFMDDYQVTSMLQKNPRIPSSVNKKEVAISKFYAAEMKCRQTNFRLRRVMYEGDTVPPDILRAIHFARENARTWLGPLTKADLHYAESNMRFGPGATTSLSGVVTQGKKYSRPAVDATPRVASFRAFGFPELWAASVDHINVQQCSKLTTVPKNAKTDRVICIEPDLNIFVQLGIGALLREKLRIHGLDLSTQDNNRYKAQRAHRSDLCTMDLSAASDTISREVIWYLLPDRWGHLLHWPRVDKTRMPDGTDILLEKWSSMGNGYTFELETLIFAAVISGVLDSLEIRRDIAVYGDDLIFPAEAYDLAVRTLEFLGFSVNREKTFGKGRFHESCGTDWFDGHNVRPFFLRSELHDFNSICYLYANMARRWAHRRNNGGSCDSRMLPVWLRCFRAVEPHHRHLIPEGVGDGGFVVDFDFAKPPISRKTRGWAGYRYRYRYLKPRESRISDYGCLLASLNQSLSPFSFGREALRGRFLPPQTKDGYSLEWPNLGPWI